jgi:hypothetical protein
MVVEPDALPERPAPSRAEARGYLEATFEELAALCLKAGEPEAAMRSLQALLALRGGASGASERRAG